MLMARGEWNPFYPNQMRGGTNLPGFADRGWFDRRVARSKGAYPIDTTERIKMKTYQAVTLAMVAGIGVGATAVASLHAQAQPPAYYVAMNDLTDQANYAKQFLPKITPTIVSAGGQFLVRGGAATGMKGPAPKSRIVIIRFDNMDKLMGWWKSPATIDAQKIGDKYATIHSFAVEGVAQ